MILFLDAWHLSVSTGLSLQRFSQHMSIKCHLSEIPHGLLSRWRLCHREGVLACRKITLPGDVPRHCIIHHQMLLARETDCCQLSFTVVKRRGWFLTEVRIILTERVLWYKDGAKRGQVCLGLALQSWASHFTSLGLWAYCFYKWRTQIVLCNSQTWLCTRISGKLFKIQIPPGLQLANFFYKGPGSTYFRFCRLYDLHCNCLYSLLPLCSQSIHRGHVYEWAQMSGAVFGQLIWGCVLLPPCSRPCVASQGMDQISAYLQKFLQMIWRGSYNWEPPD